MNRELSRQFQAELLNICIFESKVALGREAARDAVIFIRKAIEQHGSARLLFSAANSQLPMIENLTVDPDINWRRVEVFHVDEYVGLPPAHAASFGGWLKRNVVEKVHPLKAHYIAGDARNIEDECQRYAELLRERPIDISFLGIGENGHIGFNDPHEADFSDPKSVKVVTLDERCRLQQVGEGHWPSLASVPQLGVTTTCPALVNASRIICCVPGVNKAEAVRNTLEGPISTACPASIIRKHPDAKLYLDMQSASLLTRVEQN